MKKYGYEVLNNGLTVRSLSVDSVHSITIALFIPTSSLKLDKKNAGIFHFLEHMAFRQMDEWSQKEIYYYTEKIGGTLQGMTYNDYIKYSITVLPKYFSDALDIMIRVLKPIEWKSTDISAEKEVVINQIKFQGYYNFEKETDKIYYVGTGNEYQIMGSKSNVRAFSGSMINSVRSKIFAVNHCCIVLAGKIDADMLDKARVRLAALPYSSEGQPIAARQPERVFCRTEKDLIFLPAPFEYADLLISFDVPDRVDLNELAFLSGIIGQGDGSLLSSVLRERLAYTNEVYSYIKQLRCGTRFVIQCETTHEHVSDCIQEIFNVLDRVKCSIDEEAYFASRPFYTENRVMIYDDTERLADWLGYRFIYPDGFSTIDEMVHKCEKISVESLKKAALGLFISKHLYVATSCKGKANRLRVEKIVNEWRKRN